MVKWGFDSILISPSLTSISSSLTSISPLLTSILPSLAFSKPSFTHFAIIEKLHRLPWDLPCWNYKLPIFSRGSKRSPTLILKRSWERKCWTCFMSPELERYSVAISTSRCLLLISCDLKCMFFICASFGFRGIPMCIYIFSRLLFSRKRERSLFLYFLFIHTLVYWAPRWMIILKGR